MATITETGTIDLKAQKKAHDEAAKTATNYITADSTGITIRMSSSATTYQKLTSTDTTWYTSGKKRSNISADGLKVFIGDAGSEVQVASLGADILLGKPGDCKVSITSSGMDVISSQSGNPIISAKIRNDETTGLVELHFVGIVSMTLLDNQTTYVISVHQHIYQLKNIVIYGTNSTISGTVYAGDSRKIIVSSTYYNKLVDVTFTTEDNIPSVGVGEEATSLGPGSIAIGRSSTYGEYSLATGESTAYGERSVAIGGGASIGYGSLAAGGYTRSVGFYSQAFGYETIANGVNQTVIGKDNAPSDTDLFQIGNGTSNNARSNALSVDQSGNIVQHLTTQTNQYIKTPTRTAPWVSLYEGDVNGSGVVIGSGGLTIIGAGESASALHDQLIRTGTTNDAESMYVASDGSVFIVPNCGTIDNRVTYQFNSSGVNLSNKVVSNASAIELSPSSSDSNNGGFIDFHYNQSSSNYTSRIIETSSGKLTVYADNGLVTSKHITATSGQMQITTTLLDRDGSAPSSDTFLDGSCFRFLDKDNEILGYFQAFQRSNGKIGSRIVTFNEPTGGGTAVYNTFSVIIAKDGTKSYECSDPAAFRNMLGASSGIFPRSVGGTGQPERSTGTVTRTGLSTAGTIVAYSNGVMNTITAYSCTLKAALTAGNSVELATLPTGYRPPTNMYAVVASGSTAGEGNGHVTIDSNGIVTFKAAVAWSTSATIAFTISWAK